MLITLDQRRQEILARHLDHWLGVMLDTAPVDRAAAMAALRACYGSYGRMVPDRILLAPSPLAAIISSEALFHELLEQSGRSVELEEAFADSDRRAPSPGWSRLAAAERTLGLAWNSASRAARGEPRGASEEQTLAQLSAAFGAREAARLLALSGRLRALGRSWGDTVALWSYTRLPHTLARVIALYTTLEETSSCELERMDRQARDHLSALASLFRASGGAVLRDEFAVIIGRPSRVRRDAAGRLHAEDGPAIAYSDGFSVHAWHGVEVPTLVIERPHEIPLSMIGAEENVEVRRVMLERFGLERYVAGAGLHPIASDEIDGLTRRLYALGQLRIIEVENATPESDGSRKRFFLGARPGAASPHQAIAASYGIASDVYAEAVRT